jgi:hypothetical protein
MFVGSIPHWVRKWLCNEVRDWTGNVWVACSGNFTSEQILSIHSKVKAIYSEDVSFYTSFIGHYLAKKKPMDCAIVNDGYKPFEFYLRGESPVAGLLTLLQLLENEKKDYYHMRIYRHIQEHFAEIYEQNRQKIEPVLSVIKVKNYYAEDVFEFIHRVPEDETIMLYPPTYTGGYERIWKKLELMMEWKRPEYQLIDSNLYLELFRLVQNKRYLFYADRPLEGPEVLRVELPGKHTIFLYSNTIGQNAYIDKRETVEIDPRLDVVNEDVTFTPESQIDVKIMAGEAFDHYRLMWIKKVKQFSKAQYNLAFFIDGKLFGLASFSKGAYAMDGYYLLQADFVSPYSRYKRLSKLVLGLVKTRDIRQILEHKFEEKVLGLRTAVYTDRPVSMKYRGEFELTARKENKLIYSAEFTELSLKEAYLSWLKRNGSELISESTASNG